MGNARHDENINKDEILTSAERDGFRGQYTAWGDLHFSSVFIGVLLGAGLVLSVVVAALYLSQN